jgi:RNA-directed DNA polymerase
LQTGELVAAADGEGPGGRRTTNHGKSLAARGDPARGLTSARQATLAVAGSQTGSRDGYIEHEGLFCKIVWGVISPLLSNLYLNEVDRMLERAKEITRNGRYTYIEYVRYADDLVILVDAYPRHDWLLRAADKRLREELAKLHVEINEEKSRVVDLGKGESFGFLGFEFRRIRSLRGVWRPEYVPKLRKRTALLQKLRDIFRRFQSQPVGRVVELINPILRGWVNYFAVGHSSRCFGFVKDWVEKKIRRHLMRARGRQGFGWARWSRRWLYERLGLFNDYRVRRASPSPKALPAQ